MSKTGAKSVAMTVAAGVLTFGVQQLTAGDVATGVVGMVVGLSLFFGYQLAEERDHADAYNQVIDAVGEDTIKRLSEMGADELDDLLTERRSE